MDLREIQETPIWKLYTKGQNFHRRVGIYTDSKRNYQFYNGDQWEGAKLGDVEPVQNNFIKPIVKYKCAVIHDNLYAIVYNSENHENPDFRETSERLCEMLNGYAARIWEQDKMDFKLRRVTKDAAINGEGIFYVDFDRETMMPKNEIIEKVDIYYGDENNDDIQAQPYILIRKRMPQSNAIELALSLGMSEDKEELIICDNDTLEGAAEPSEIEVDDQVTIVYKFYKKDDTVHFSVASRLVTITEDEDMGISRYPIVHMIWEEKKGSARGEGEVKNLIPNQIEVNRTEIRRILTVKFQAYPKMIADVSKITNPQSLNTVGGIIKTSGQAVDDVHKIVGTLPPAQMSPDVKVLLDDLIQKSRDLAGAGDTATGEVNPEDASGRAILAVQQAQRAPITEQKESCKDTIEDLGKMWLEFLIVHAVDGVNLEEKVTDPYTGQETIQIVKVPQSALEQLQASVKIDITPKSAYDRLALEQTLENLLTGGFLSAQRFSEFKAYVKALPNDSVAPKIILEGIVEDMEKEMQKIATIQANAHLMQQRAAQFLMEDPDGQADQIADAQMMLEAQANAQPQAVEGEEEVIAEEEAIEKKASAKEKK
jgi:hypothetical protein